MIKKTNTNTKTDTRITAGKRAKGKPARQHSAAGRETAKSSIREITFAVYRPRAERVFLSGAFNGWSTESTPLTRQPNRDWKTTVALPPGRYEYKFVVDGEWIIDPRASQSAPNGFGTLNSVIEVTD